MEKSVVSFTFKQNIICSQTQLHEHEQTFICRQFFVGQPMKKFALNDKIPS